MGQVEEALGPLLIGAMFDIYLFGIVSSQYAQYHGTKFDDPRWIKLVITFLCILDTFQTAVTMYWTYDQLVTHFNDPGHVMLLTLKDFWPFSWSWMSNCLNTFAAEAFLTYRIYCFTKSRLILACFSLLIIVVFSLGTTVSIMGFIATSHKNYPEVFRLNLPIKAWRVSEVVLDLSLAFILIYNLHRRRTGYKRSESIINSVVGHAARTGLLLAVYSITNAAVYMISPGVVACFVLSQGKVATNALLTSLLKRQDFQKQVDRHGTSLFQELDFREPREPTSVGLEVRRDVHMIVVGDTSATDGTRSTEHTMPKIKDVTFAMGNDDEAASRDR